MVPVFIIAVDTLIFTSWICVNEERLEKLKMNSDQQVSSNPMQQQTPPSNTFQQPRGDIGQMKSRATEVISLLSSEIEQGIRNITDKDIPKSQVKREIERIKEQAFKVERAPEAEFALQLYRRYADLAENIKAKHTAADKDNNSLLGDVPSYLYEATTEDIPSGVSSAFQHNKFWLRAIVCMFCFLTYVIMSTVPNITTSYLYPEDAFLPGCTSGPIDGYFYLSPFQLVIVASALEYAHSLLFTIFYILPVDEDNQKFIPGLERAFILCTGSANQVQRQ